MSVLRVPTSELLDALDTALDDCRLVGISANETLAHMVRHYPDLDLRLSWCCCGTCAE